MKSEKVKSEKVKMKSMKNKTRRGAEPQRLKVDDFIDLQRFPAHLKAIISETEKVRGAAYQFRRRAWSYMHAVHDVLYTSTEKIVLYDAIHKRAAELYVDGDRHDKAELDKIDQAIRQEIWYHLEGVKCNEK